MAIRKRIQKFRISIFKREVLQLFGRNIEGNHPKYLITKQVKKVGRRKIPQQRP